MPCPAAAGVGAVSVHPALRCKPIEEWPQGARVIGIDQGLDVGGHGFCFLFVCTHAVGLRPSLRGRGALAPGGFSPPCCLVARSLCLLVVLSPDALASGQAGFLFALTLSGFALRCVGAARCAGRLFAALLPCRSVALPPCCLAASPPCRLAGALVRSRARGWWPRPGLWRGCFQAPVHF